MIYYDNKKSIMNGFNSYTSIPVLSNLEMQLRHCCNHPWLLKNVEDEIMKDISENYHERIQKMIESSGKFILLDKLLPKLRSEKNKILIFSQFVLILNMLEE